MNRLLAVLRLALWAAFSKPSRAALLIATLGGGAAGVAVAAGVMSGYAREMERMTFGAYARSLVITENAFLDDRFGPPRLADIPRLQEALGDSVEAWAAWRSATGDVRYGREQANLPVRGVLGDYQREADMPLEAGRVLTLAETQGADRLCMLGAGAARQLFGNDPAVGEAIRINGISCDVVGVFAEAENQLAERYRQSVFAPFTAAARYFENAEAFGAVGPNEVSQLTIVLTPETRRRAALMTADQTLRRSHGVPQAQVSPFEYADPAAPTRALERQRDLIARLLITIAAVTVAVALTGYAAAANAAVDMRRREIALQMMSGATGRLITAQVLIEGLIIGLAASVAGSALVMAGAGLAQTLARFPFELNPGVIALTFAAGALTGLIASLPPARRAAAGSPALSARG